MVGIRYVIAVFFFVGKIDVYLALRLGLDSFEHRFYFSGRSLGGLGTFGYSLGRVLANV